MKGSSSKWQVSKRQGCKRQTVRCKQQSTKWLARSGKQQDGKRSGGKRQASHIKKSRNKRQGSKRQGCKQQAARRLASRRPAARLQLARLQVDKRHAAMCKAWLQPESGKAENDNAQAARSKRKAKIKATKKNKCIAIWQLARRQAVSGKRLGSKRQGHVDKWQVQGGKGKHQALSHDHNILYTRF